MISLFAIIMYMLIIVDEHQQNSPPGGNPSSTCGLKHGNNGNNGSGSKFLTVPGKSSFGKSNFLLFLFTNS